MLWCNAQRLVTSGCESKDARVSVRYGQLRPRNTNRARNATSAVTHCEKGLKSAGPGVRVLSGGNSGSVAGNVSGSFKCLDKAGIYSFFAALSSR